MRVDEMGLPVDIIRSRRSGNKLLNTQFFNAEQICLP